jgi:DtxR family transcriptional regulator, Mn-dependent transcriptional regulator
MRSFTEENYLKIIFKLSRQTEGEVSTNAIAGLTQTKPSSVSDMLKKLADKQWIEYKKYQGVKLTEEGEKIALQIIRNHRLWEVFLAEKLGFQWDEVHEVAEELEHINHPLLISRLDEFLEFPVYDPHGDPIPDASGQMNEVSRRCLQDLKVEERVVISGVRQSGDTLLRHLDKLGLKIGTHCQITEVLDFDGSLQILTDRGEKLLISREVARNILVNN